MVRYAVENFGRPHVTLFQVNILTRFDTYIKITVRYECNSFTECFIKLNIYRN